jgi:hypothetical protein
MVEVFLSIPPRPPISFLLIPLDDIERLAVCPHRWIRYVMFSICGVGGVLSATPRGGAVEYDTTDFSLVENAYYYLPEGKRSFCV